VVVVPKLLSASLTSGNRGDLHVIVYVDINYRLPISINFMASRAPLLLRPVVSA